MYCTQGKLTDSRHTERTRYGVWVSEVYEGKYMLTVH